MCFNISLRTVSHHLIIAFSVVLLFGCSQRREAPAGSLDYFRQNLTAGMDISEIKETFGETKVLTNPTVSVYKYHLVDSTEVWIGYTDKIVYACFVDERHNLVEDLVHVEEAPL